jgi:hypothetical protein
MSKRNSSDEALLALAGTCTAFWRFDGFGGISSPNLAMFSPKSKHRDLKSFLETTDAREVSCAVLGFFWMQDGDDPT